MKNIQVLGLGLMYSPLYLDPTLYHNIIYRMKQSYLTLCGSKLK